MLPSESYFKYEIVIEAIERLISIMQNDPLWVQQSNFDALQERLEERMDLVEFLMLQRETLKNYPEIVASLDDEQKKHLKLLSVKLNEVGEISHTWLSKALFVNERVLTVLAKAIKKTHDKNISYSRAGKMAKKRFTESQHLALNQNY